MATYHIMAVPKAGENPSSETRPLAPHDIVADSDDDALSHAHSLIAESVGEFYESILATRGDEAADAFYATTQRWQPMVRRVKRPRIDVRPRSWTTDALRDGEVVGSHFHYGEETGDQAFDVLVEDATCGCLVEGWRRSLALSDDGQRHEIRVWSLREATGVLAPLAGLVWEDYGGPGQLRGFVLPSVALTAVRAQIDA
jgi:hypothetical protein